MSPSRWLFGCNGKYYVGEKKVQKLDHDDVTI